MTFFLVNILFSARLGLSTRGRFGSLALEQVEGYVLRDR